LLASRLALSWPEAASRKISMVSSWIGSMPQEYQPIENYGVIGNLQTVALVGIDGSIDFLCFPYFDSPTLFGGLLDAQRGGHFSLSPLFPIQPAKANLDRR